MCSFSFIDCSGNNNNNGGNGNNGVYGIYYFSDMVVDENNLTRYEYDYKYEYNMIKNGDTYTLTFLLGDDENLSFETVILKMIETGLEISYVGGNGEVTLIFINV